MELMLFICIALFAITFYIYYKDPRTVFLGLSSVLALAFLYVYIIVLSEVKRGPAGYGSYNYLLVAVLLITAGVLMLFPIVFIITLITKGIKLIKREGFSLRNLLSLGLGLFLLFFPILSSMYITAFKDNRLLMLIYRIGMFIFFYVVLIVIGYTFASLINSVHFGNKNLDYVVVLGSGLNKDRVTPLLAGRIDRGIKVYRNNGSAKLIMSGGKGADELIAEGEAMRNYALEQGVPEEDIIVENKSRNTRENIIFSRNLMEENSRFAIVTNYYHLFRALLTARSADIRCIGYGSRTKLYFSINAFIREIIGYIYLKRKFHIIFTLCITALLVMTQLITSGFAK